MGGLGIGLAIGPLLSGVLYEHLGYLAPFIANALLCLLDLILRLVLLTRQRGQPLSANAPNSVVLPALPSDTSEQTDRLLAAESDNAVTDGSDTAVTSNSDTALIEQRMKQDMAMKAHDEESGQAATSNSSSQPAVDMSLRAQLRRLFTDAQSVSTLAMTMLVTMSTSLVELVYALYLDESLQASTQSIGVIFCLSNLAYGVCSVIAGELGDRFGHVKSMLAGCCIASLSVLLLLLASNVYIAGLVLALAGGCIGIGSMPTLTVLERRAIHIHIGDGLIVGAWNGMFGLGLAIGPPVGGALLSGVGYRGTIITCCVIDCTAAVVMVVMWSRNWQAARMINMKKDELEMSHKVGLEKAAVVRENE
eukprot:TRINITY_DN7605_c0_g1_i1.p1 TRINITY_DN7605_c0_g1~~TRINITY_DN7605_c0_g1_i1.p1  ORF type:complete len:364 (-),score=68.71 TRINITY_DN7605_c0_g1_i1:101-1192(-)